MDDVYISLPCIGHFSESAGLRSRQYNNIAAINVAVLIYSHVLRQIVYSYSGQFTSIPFCYNYIYKSALVMIVPFCDPSILYRHSFTVLSSNSKQFVCIVVPEPFLHCRSYRSFKHSIYSVRIGLFTRCSVFQYPLYAMLLKCLYYMNRPQDNYIVCLWLYRRAAQ